MTYLAKAKPVRVRIKSGDKEHATYESLLENFCVKDLLPLVSNGMLSTWLTKHNRTEEAQKVEDFKKHGDDIKFEQYIEFVQIFFEIPEVKTMEDLYKYWSNTDNYKNNAKYVEIDRGQVDISLFLEEYKKNKKKFSTEEWLKKFYDIKRKEKSLGDNFQTAYQEVQQDLLAKYRADKASLSEEEWTKLFNLCDLNEFKVISSNFAVNTNELGSAFKENIKTIINNYLDKEVKIDIEKLINSAKTVLEKDFYVFMAEVIHLPSSRSYYDTGDRFVPLFMNYPFKDKRYESWLSFFYDLNGESFNSDFDGKNVNCLYKYATSAGFGHHLSEIAEKDRYTPSGFPQSEDVTSLARIDISHKEKKIHLSRNVTVPFNGYYRAGTNGNDRVTPYDDNFFKEFLRHITEII